MDANGLDEVQMVLRFEDENVAAEVHKLMESEVAGDTGLRFEFFDERRGELFINGHTLPCKLCDLPCYTQLLKTLDNSSHYVAGDIAQILFVGPNAYSQPNFFPDGLTPLTKAIRTSWQRQDEDEKLSKDDIDLLWEKFRKVIQAEKDPVTVEELWVPEDATDEDILAGKYSQPQQQPQPQLEVQTKAPSQTKQPMVPSPSSRGGGGGAGTPGGVFRPPPLRPPSLGGRAGFKGGTPNSAGPSRPVVVGTPRSSDQFQRPASRTPTTAHNRLPSASPMNSRPVASPLSALNPAEQLAVLQAQLSRTADLNEKASLASRISRLKQQQQQQNQR